MRIFKTKWFNKEAHSHAINDDELCCAIKAALQGKADNLAAASSKNALIRIVTVPLFWLKGVNIGFTHFCTLNKICRLSAIASWLGSVS
ncbi:Uncharacterized protein conserved in bacteria [Kluyvera intermedia]|nr:Uncharacterized protein conserved in bacteria [Kluyvera intermedia]